MSKVKNQYGSKPLTFDVRPLFRNRETVGDVTTQPEISKISQIYCEICDICDCFVFEAATLEMAILNAFKERHYEISA